MKSSPRTTAYIFLLITAIIWGFAGPIIKYTLTYFPPSVFLTYRFAISSMIAIIWFFFTPKLYTKKVESPGIIIFYCFLMSTGVLGLLFLGFDKTTALTGSIFSALTPITTTIAGALFLREHVTHREKIGMGLAMTGTIVMIFEPMIFGNVHGIPVSFEGNLFHLSAMFLNVLSVILAKILMRRAASPSALTNTSFVIGFLTMLPITLLSYSLADIMNFIVAAPLSGHLGVWYMALLSGTLAYILWHIGERSIEVGETSLFTYLHPLFAAPLSLLWLDEPITPFFFMSALIIASGVLLAEYRKSITSKRKKAHLRRRIR